MLFSSLLFVFVNVWGHKLAAYALALALLRKGREIGTVRLVYKLAHFVLLGVVLVPPSFFPFLG